MLVLRTSNFQGATIRPIHTGTYVKNLKFAKDSSIRATLFKGKVH